MTAEQLIAVLTKLPPKQAIVFGDGRLIIVNNDKGSIGYIS